MEDNTLECPVCGAELEEDWGLFTDNSDEYGDSHEGLVGYHCPDCDTDFTVDGEEK